MTRLLEEAFARVSELPADAQDELARWLLSELESERRWSKMFDESGDALARMRLVLSTGVAKRKCSTPTSFEVSHHASFS